MKVDDEATGLGVKYKNAIHEMGTVAVERLTKTWLHFDWIFVLSSMYYKQKKLLKIIRQFPSRVINERKAYMEEFSDQIYLEGTTNENEVFMKNKKRMAMLDLLLAAEKENLIDRAGIQEEVDTFMFEVSS